MHATRNMASWGRAGVQGTDLPHCKRLEKQQEGVRLD